MKSIRSETYEIRLGDARGRFWTYRESHNRGGSVVPTAGSFADRTRNAVSRDASRMLSRVPRVSCGLRALLCTQSLLIDRALVTAIRTDVNPYRRWRLTSDKDPTASGAIAIEKRSPFAGSLCTKACRLKYLEIISPWNHILCIKSRPTKCNLSKNLEIQNSNDLNQLLVNLISIIVPCEFIPSSTKFQLDTFMFARIYNPFSVTFRKIQNHMKSDRLGTFSIPVKFWY